MADDTVNLYWVSKQGRVAPRDILWESDGISVMTAGSLSEAANVYFAQEEPFFEQFARQFSLDPEVVYFMAGQKGSMPASVLTRFKDGLDQTARDPFPVYVEPSADTRKTIADCYGTSADQIAITRNTTDALALVFNGIDWQQGDEILVSPLEHPSGITTVLRTAARYGLIIRQWGVPVHRNVTADEVVAAFERQLVPGKTRAVFFSSPVWPIGQRMPEQRLAAAAQRVGALTIVDGAHYNGMIDPQLDDTGVDFFALCGHKWQCGPGGTGVLYIRNRKLPANPTELPKFFISRSHAREYPFDGSRGDWDIGAALSTYGFPESAAWRALGDACRVWDDTGRQRIQTWHLTLGDYFRDKLSATFGDDAVVGARDDPALKSGIIAFNPFPRKEQRGDEAINLAFKDRILTEYGFRISGRGVGDNGLTRPPDTEAGAFAPGMVPNRDPATLAPAPMDYPHRVNACVWNNRAQIDQFVVAAQDLVTKMT
ncbi:MAG: aminotransferase class V-fold PLP-dependent enzyme [Burkholderiaceae bacterium]